MSPGGPVPGDHAELLEAPATVIAARVSAGELSAREVTDVYLAQIERAEPEVSAYIEVTADLARKQAASVDEAVARGENPGELAGVPVAIKDLLCIDGIRTTCGSKILGNWVPPYTATAVLRLIRAGAICIGKTNMDEFAMGSSTENSAFGPTKNPWDSRRVPGGSSGGSAAAVAAREAAVALGSDTGGSIRQPASLCGVVGMKPTYGRVSRYGLVAFASSLDQIGPFARDVASAAATYEVIAGHDPKDSTSIPEPPGQIDPALAAGVSGMRLGVVRELSEAGIDAEVAGAFRVICEKLAEAGAEVDEVELPSFDYALSAYYLIAPAEASSNLARYDGVRYGLRAAAEDVTAMMRRTRAEGFGTEVKCRIMLGTYALSAGYYDAYYGQAQKVRTLVSSDFSRAFGQFDALLSPTSPTTAFGLGEKVDDPLTMYLSDICTIPANLAGIPGMSVPAALDSKRLPIGVQVMAPALGEDTLFRVGAAIEAAAGFDARPSVADGDRRTGGASTGDRRTGDANGDGGDS